MAGMYFAGAATFESFASGTILVVAIAVIGSLTVLPAVLSKLGDRVNKARVPFLTPPEERVKRESRVWNAVLNPVLRRPAIAAALGTAVLVVMAIPVFGLKMAVPGIDSLPQDLQVIQTYDRIQAAFPGNQIPAEVVIERGDASQAEVSDAVRELRAETGRIGPVRAAAHGRRQPRPQRHGRRGPDRGRRDERHLVRGARRTCATT